MKWIKAWFKPARYDALNRNIDNANSNQKNRDYYCFLFFYCSLITAMFIGCAIVRT